MDNAAASVTHFAIAEWEDAILCIAERCFAARGIPVNSLHCDGILVHSDSEIDARECIESAEKEVRDDLGLEIQFAIKKDTGFWDSLLAVCAGEHKGDCVATTAESCVAASIEWVIGDEKFATIADFDV